MTNELILSWNPEGQSWLPVGRLSFENQQYVFQYTYGAKDAKSPHPFAMITDLSSPSMTDLDSAYVSDELFPLFKNRILAKSRPEYERYLGWIDLSRESNSPFEELARTGGSRATDSLQVFPVPEKKDNYEVIFLSRGIRELSPDEKEKVEQLAENESLFLKPNPQSTTDRDALALYTEEPCELAGYCPDYFVGEFNRLIEINSMDQVSVSVVKVNLKSPTQFRLLCKFNTPWPDDFVPFADKIFQTISATV